MRVGTLNRGMLSMMVAPLAAILVMTAAVPAILARATDNDGGACDERSFAPNDATLRIGQAVSTGRIRVFGGTVAIARGQALLLGPWRPGYVCALFANGLEARAGWVPQSRVAPAMRSVDPAPPLAAWAGTWRQFDNKIVLTRVGDRLNAKGEAYWPAKSIMPANEGEFSGTAAPSGRSLHFAGDGPDPCLVDLTLAGEFLFVDDNRMCGGHNAVFSGIFIRRPERTK
jgi:hypothetical protein